MFKKGVDKKRQGMYNTSSRLTKATLPMSDDRSLKTIQNREDKRETVIFTSHGQNKDSQFVHEF